MDRITTPLAQDVLARTVENGGDTFEARTLLPQTWAAGYAVALGGATIKATEATPAAIAWIAKAVAGEFETTYAGTWLDGDRLCIDAVRYFAPDNRERAIEAGRAAGQKAIYDFGTGGDIVL